MIKKALETVCWLLFPVLERFGVHITPVHYYSPIPNTRLLDRNRKQFEMEHPMHGIDIRSDDQFSMLKEVVSPYQSEYIAAGNGEFGVSEGAMRSYAPLNGLILYAFIRYFHPRRMIEVGSGMSTRIASAAFTRNSREGFRHDYTVIDPYASEHVRRDCGSVATFVNQPVEQTSMDSFGMLGNDDILFIDSSHTVRVFGDVNHLFLTVLPQIKPGVLIHVHDIFFPMDYLPHHFLAHRVKQIWQEQYLLHAFLLFNEAFRIELCASYLHKKRMADLRQLFEWYHPHRCPSSFWMRRIYSA